MIAARDWYDGQSAGLGNQFIDAVAAAARSACDGPNRFPTIGHGVRTVRCKRFPYRLYFKVRSDRVDVLAVYHSARNPNLWNHPGRP
jgi:toxin ParE1/3/4